MKRDALNSILYDFGVEDSAQLCTDAIMELVAESTSRFSQEEIDYIIDAITHKQTFVDGVGSYDQMGTDICRKLDKLPMNR